MGEKDGIFSSLGLQVALSGASYGDRWFAGSGSRASTNRRFASVGSLSHFSAASNALQGRSSVRYSASKTRCAPESTCVRVCEPQYETHIEARGKKFGNKKQQCLGSVFSVGRPKPSCEAEVVKHSERDS